MHKKTAVILHQQCCDSASHAALMSNARDTYIYKALAIYV